MCTSMAAVGGAAVVEATVSVSSTGSDVEVVARATPPAPAVRVSATTAFAITILDSVLARMGVLRGASSGSG